MVFKFFTVNHVLSIDVSFGLAMAFGDSGFIIWKAIQVLATL